jgi:acetyl-CoA synthetase
MYWIYLCRYAYELQQKTARLRRGAAPSEAPKKELREHVVKQIGALARPDDIRFTDALPKTSAGKIMPRLLRNIAAGRQIA